MVGISAPEAGERLSGELAWEFNLSESRLPSGLVPAGVVFPPPSVVARISHSPIVGCSW